jgi:hypothetical protein
MTRPQTSHPTTMSAVEARFAARLAAGLNEHAAGMPHDISERLRIGRERALAASQQARARRPAPALSLAGLSRHGAAVLGGPDGLWLRLTAWMPLVLLIGGLVLIQHWNDRESVLAAAEIDAGLLADDVPPAAWSDPGFREFLKASQP